MRMAHRTTTGRTWTFITALVIALAAAACGGAGEAASDGEATSEGEPSSGASSPQGAGDSPDEGVTGTFTIASNNPMTGTYAEFGEWFRNAGEMGIEAANEAHAEQGVDFEILFEDNNNDPQTAVSNMLRLANEGIVPHIISGSSTLLAMAAIAEENDVVLMNAAGSTPQMRGSTANLFSAISDSSYDVRALVDLAVKDMAFERVGFIAPDNAQGRDAADVAVSQMGELDEQFVAQEFVGEHDTDLRPALLSLRDADVDAIVMFNSGAQAGTLLNQAAELGVEAQFLGWTAAVTPATLEEAGENAEGVISSSLPYDPASNSVAEAFATDYEEQFGEAPTVYSAVMYDSVMLLADAIAAEGYDVDAILEYLDGVSDYQGASGTINFDEDNVRQGQVRLMQVVDGEQVPFEP